MTSSVATITHLLASVILVSDLAIAALLALIVLNASGYAKDLFDDVVAFFEDWGILVSFLAVLGSLLGSLYYSEIAGFPPCEFCILQRIFMYPQIVFLLAALVNKSHRSLFVLMSLLFSIAGAVIAAYHYYGQMFNQSALPCSATGISCAAREFIEFGYITIPIMSFTAFSVIIISLSFYGLAKRRAARLSAVR